ncbi:universal stress protein [Leisingera sp. S232]|uniref:universal stress protein n=1 Tax=Leisingera sp. S232 TaxID=3415132 RepID=UPI003C7ACDC9
MTIKSILCAYSGDEAKGSGLRHAIRLAKHHSAHLTGVLRHGTSTLANRYAAHVPNALLSYIRETDAKHIGNVRRRFESAVKAEGIPDRAEFVELDPAKDGPLSEFAHGFDLIVAGVHSEAATEAHLSANPDILALKSGRPVLVVPDAYDATGLADRALVAWDGKRSATRAIGDSMSILAEKSHVTLLSVGNTPRGTDRMVANMQRQGVEVDARTVKRSGSIAETILSAAQSDGAKLIVTGAFEHSKFSHDLFGGVTTDIIADAAVPVFMAH